MIVTRADPPRFPDGLVPTARREAAKAHAILGYRDAVFLDFPAAELDQVPHADINHRLGEISADVRPDTVFLPFPGDIHLDH